MKSFMKTFAPRLAVLVVALAVPPACSSEDPADAGDVDIVDVQVASNQFTPATVTIRAGQTVRWTWAGGTHNVQSGSNCTPDDTFRSGQPASGGTFDRKFDVAGTFPYYCEPHCSMGMKGVVIVQ